MLSVQDISFSNHQENTVFDKSFDELELTSDTFDLTIYLTIGDGEVGSNYYFYLDSNYDSRYDKPTNDNYEIYFRQKGVYSAQSFDKFILMNFINRLVTDKTFGLSLEKRFEALSNYFHWEFDNYYEISCS